MTLLFLYNKFSYLYLSIINSNIHLYTYIYIVYNSWKVKLSQILGNGFYLYTHDDLDKIEKGQCQVHQNITASEDDKYDFFEEMLKDDSVQIIFVSLWYYWYVFIQ